MKPDDMCVAATVPATLHPQPVCEDALREHYAQGDESCADEVQRRVAVALAAAEKPDAREQWARAFFDAQARGFIAAGRINTLAGSDAPATLIDGFALPVGDSIAGQPGIYTALLEAAETLRRGAAVGCDFSPIRPQGAWVAGTGARASGPLSYVPLFAQSGRTLAPAAGQMALLRCDHPDIERFIDAKRDGSLADVNLGVAVSDAFLRAVEADGEVDLWHEVRPADPAQAIRRADGCWVYRRARAGVLWRRLLEVACRAGGPAVIFIDRVNAENNLSYCESPCAADPCGGPWPPPYGGCPSGSINLTRFVRHPFSDEAAFDFAAFEEVVPVAVRMLDNVLEVTHWPLARQAQEARAKRRIGLGFLGLGDVLCMLGLRYCSEKARLMARAIAERLRDAAYRASIELAKERGAFALFDAERYLAAPHAASRLPQVLQEAIRRQGMRNSHLLSIAAAGAMPLALADNASSGLEPVCGGRYSQARLPDGGQREDGHALRLYRQLSGETHTLPAGFVAAEELGAIDHLLMTAAVQPFVDGAVGETVRVRADYPLEAFEKLYRKAWHQGLKGLATLRPKPAPDTGPDTGDTRGAGVPLDLDQSDPDRRLRLERQPQPPLASLRWPGRPQFPGGNPCWAYAVEHPAGAFAVFVGHIGAEHAYPFEVWVNGAEQPRGLGAVAKTLSMDMRTDDRAWLDMKLQALEHAAGDDGFELAMPPQGEPVRVPSLVAGFARLVRYRCAELGAFGRGAQEPTPVVDALIARKEPKARGDGTMSWTVDVFNHATGDDFALFVKELAMPDGQRRPYSLWLAGVYPRVLDGLCKLLSLDMRVVDAAWIGMKLRKLLNYAEAHGAFQARIPGTDKRVPWPSTVAYVARLVIHRYAMLGILSEEGHPVAQAGILQMPAADTTPGACR